MVFNPADNSTMPQLRGLCLFQCDHHIYTRLQLAIFPAVITYKCDDYIGFVAEFPKYRYIVSLKTFVNTNSLFTIKAFTAICCCSRFSTPYLHMFFGAINPTIHHTSVNLGFHNDLKIPTLLSN